MAAALGTAPLIIGLTVVSFGTSAPEIITAIIAAWRGHGDLAIGSVVGSNIANICLVGSVSPQGIPIPLAVIDFDMPVMIAAALSCLPIFAINGRIDRWEGGLFVGYFVAYTAYVLLAAADHDALPAFSGIMWTFVFPLTAITFIIVSWQAMRTT